MSNFNPVSNGFGFTCTAQYNIEDTANQSQRIQAEHVDLIGKKTSDANSKMIDADNKQMGLMPKDTGSKTYSEEVQEWQTKYNLINTEGQMFVNELQTEAQNDGTNLQAIGNFIQNAIQIQTAVLSPLQTIISLLQSGL